VKRGNVYVSKIDLMRVGTLIRDAQKKFLIARTPSQRKALMIRITREMRADGRLPPLDAFEAMERK
jgi:hypothetical protein